ncbi:serine hydroxymethyltransferase, putative [Babesia ovis]|uniref:Serine hydroxymethyltransferase, putative n=1 Tax=Babesia ovis TaxID=5869 RepID=A0A9W5TDV3_BABOV|nr:serine hydroxymethyltransferase, putative [Babesia ovis]
MATALAIKLSTIAFKNLGKVNKFNFTGGADEGEAVNEVEKDEENQNNQYDWDVLNYPWGINLVHYDPKELEPKYSKFVRLANYGAFTAYAAMLINVVDVIALASMGVHPMRVLYTLFNIILVAPITWLVSKRTYKTIQRPHISTISCTCNKKQALRQILHGNSCITGIFI